METRTSRRLHGLAVFVWYMMCVLALWALQSCAVVRPPDGGPEDKIPPTVAVASEAFTQTNFRGESITLVFSEAVEHARVQDCISISPELALSYSWSGRSLTITFDSSLQAATTYALTVGTQYADLHGNAPISATTIVFSTGAFLDKGIIGGRVVDDKPQGILVYLYALRDTSAVASSISSELKVGTTKPTYKTQVGTDGSFRFAALPDGNYRILALRDNDNDGVFTFGTDAAANAPGDLHIASGATGSVLLRMTPAADIMPAELIEVRPRSNTRLDLQWSEPLSASYDLQSNIILCDTTGRVTIRVLSAFPSVSSATSWTILTQPILRDAPLRVAFSAHGLPADTAGNITPDSLARTVFTPTTISEVLSPSLLSVSIKDSTELQDCTPSITFTWNTALQTERDSTAHVAGGATRTPAAGKLLLSCMQGSVQQPVRVQYPAANRVVVSPADTLQSDTWYTFSMRTSSLLNAAGERLADTVLQRRVHTPDLRLYGSIHGTIIDSSASSDAVVVRLLRGTAEIRRITGTSRQFVFDKLPPGEYAVDVFVDSNHDGLYTSGKPHPWQAAEHFAPKRTKLMVRPRWALDDCIITIPAAK
ncbi:MAG: hypothetical protein RL156_927 [Bacteroidota bacterium]